DEQGRGRVLESLAQDLPAEGGPPVERPLHAVRSGGVEIRLRHRIPGVAALPPFREPGDGQQARVLVAAAQPVQHEGLHAEERRDQEDGEPARGHQRSSTIRAAVFAKTVRCQGWTAREAKLSAPYSCIRSSSMARCVTPYREAAARASVASDERRSVRSTALRSAWSPGRSLPASASSTRRPVRAGIHMAADLPAAKTTSGGVRLRIHSA